MSPPGAAVAAPAVPSAWSEQDRSVVTYRLRALGATEAQVDRVLHDLAARGVRRLRAYVDKMTDEQIVTAMATADASDVAEHAGLARGLDGRGDLGGGRTPRRFRWRTSWGQDVTRHSSVGC